MFLYDVGRKSTKHLLVPIDRMSYLYLLMCINKMYIRLFKS